MSTNLADAEKTRADASDKLDAARMVRDTLDATAVAKRVAEMELARRDAVLNSQLHSFTGMFFGKDPTEVTEGELHSFLRFFVFFPAIFASLAATALALASVTPLREAPEAIEVDEQALVDQLLYPLTRSLDEHAEKAANVAVARAFVAHKIEPQAPEIPTPPATPSKVDEPAAAEPTAKAEEPAEPPRPFGPARPTLVATNPPPGAA